MDLITSSIKELEKACKVYAEMVILGPYVSENRAWLLDEWVKWCKLHKTQKFKDCVPGFERVYADEIAMTQGCDG